MIVHTNTGGIGDEMMVTAWVREYKRAFPDEMIRLGRHRKDLWRHNPRINVGNQDNGLSVDPLVEGWKTSGEHFPRGLALDMGFEMADPTPEIFIDPHERDAQFWPPDGRPVAALDPGAGWASRAWVDDRWQDVAAELLSAGWTVLELGAAAGHDRAHARPLLPHTWSFYGRHTIRQTASVLGQCDVLICHDSGLLHLAAAVGTPQVALFGRIKSPYRAYATTEAIEDPGPCLDACKLKCAKTPDGHAGCLAEVTAADVLAAVPRAVARRKAVLA